MKPRLRILLALLAFLLTFPPAVAQYVDNDEDGIRQSVARVSWFQGAVSFNRGDDPDDWQPASPNYPMTVGDRIWAGRDGRVELQLRGGTVYLGPETELAALDISLDVRQLSMTLGTASFRIRRMGRDEVFEVATPNASVTFETPGAYRIDVDEEGNSRVSVTQGRASVAAAGGQVSLERGEEMRVRGIDRPDYDIVRLARADQWDRWVDARARRLRSVRSASYVHPDIYGVEDLDSYGSWENSPEYGHVWYPRGMSAGWEPYRAGRWIWRDPWGWTWLSSEPWGWAPYHYGRWAVVRSRWCWVPVGPQSRYPGYSPAVVGFVGGGAGWSVSVSAGGFVGWFPLGPREPFDPWWHRSRATVDVTAFSYAYRNRATVVSRDAFVTGRSVDRDVVRDTRIVNEVSRAPVLRGPIPVLPTRESIRVSSVRDPGRAAGIRPPKQAERREVVTRSVPPPAPPTFDRKLELIREKGGEPVRPDAAKRLSVEERRGESRVLPVRPAARDEVLLSPRGNAEKSRKPEPLSSSSTRPPAAAERPALSRVEEPAPTRAQERAPAPGPRQEAESARPAPALRRADVPAPPKAKERAPAPEPRQEAESARPAPALRRADVPAPPKVEEPVTAPEPGLKREAPRPRVVPEAKAEVAKPERSEPSKARVGKVAPDAAEPDKVKGKPTPILKKGKGRSEPEPKPDTKRD